MGYYGISLFRMWHISNCCTKICQVIKPSIVGGSGNEALLAQWAHQQGKSNVVVFLGGFHGIGGDQISIMKAISGSTKCIEVDLHGLEEPRLSIMAFVNILQQLFDSLQCQKVILVGYSMGARISLYMALKYNDKVAGAVIISGSPGLIDEDARKVRRAKDDFSACLFWRSME
ncbi:protein PHYLLO, chloroplastic isoform X1 [Nicotiana tabacum]|uniref:Protein PHYLLO, chloroplastic isoform X1 n=5 Tax=Nicotiana TaxID=4085 RepID=A0AC58SWQ9_TOBAC|nr:PREDICTED: protein PHYLLO, chloroplastic-like isoform X2 [Nicotiana sylvestris]XP_016492156.1 PREDICTED: protein PHYLLO, chloroplastic-like isoform X2 [Nicotiana tabacum]